MPPPADENTFGGLFARTPASEDAIVVTDAALRIVGWNAGAEQLYGWTAAEVMGQPVSAVLRSQLTGPQRAEMLSDVGRSGEVCAEYVHHDRLGRPLRILADTLALRDAAANVLGYVSVNRDLDAARLRAQEYDMLRQAMLVGRSFAFQWTPATGRVRRSQECAAILGLEAGPAAFQESGADFVGRVHPEDRPRFMQTVQDLTPDRDTYRTRYRVLVGADEHVVLEESGRGEFDEAGRLVQVYGMTADVTNAVRGERLLQESRDSLSRQVEERTSQLRDVIASLQAEIAERKRAQAQAELQMQALRAAANGIIITDAAGQIEWANPAITAMTGYAESELPGAEAEHTEVGRARG